MVHYGHFLKNHAVQNAELQFNTQENSILFLILLADLLSPPGKLLKGSSYLGNLRRIAEKPNLSGDPSSMSHAIDAFTTWLDGHAVVENVWLPTIERKSTLRVKRHDYLTVCGTTSKHGFTHLDRVVKKICSILSENQIEIDEGEGYLTIPDFQTWFRDQVFLASSTLIAWHLNEIRWGIYEYLKPEFKRAYVPTVVVSGAQIYRFDAPPDIHSKLVKSIHWDLMNEVRTAPYFPRFTVSPYLRNIF